MNSFSSFDYTVADARVAPPHAARYLADAFADYPLAKWILQDEQDEVVARIALFEVLIEAYQALGSKFVWIEPDGPVAVWSESSLPAAMPMRQRIDLRHLFLSRLGKRTIRRLIDIETASERHCPIVGRHYVLHLIGVRKSERRNGFGRVLLSRLDQSDRLPAIAETSNSANLSFYLSLHFVSCGDYEIRLNGPKTWIFVRKAVQ